MVNSPQPNMLTELCPACGEPTVLAIALAPKASMNIIRRDFTCPHCGVRYLLTGGLVQGEAAESRAEIIPTAGGDSGGLDALLLD